MQNKVISATNAIEMIKNGSTLATTGFRWAGSPELLLSELGRRYKDKKIPCNLTIVFSSAAGDSVSNGIEHLAQKGFLERVVGGYWGLTPQLLKLALNGEFEAYNFPQGQIAKLYSSIAAKMPGLVTKIGLGTFIDPRIEGGRLNDRTPNDLVEVVTLRGEEYLLYHSFPIDIGFIRGTYADQEGNISIEQEAAHLEMLPLAMAVHNSGGKVFAQVKEVVDTENILAKSVIVPGYLVDYIVVANDFDKDHRQCGEVTYDPCYSGEKKKVLGIDKLTDSIIRKIISQRAIKELKNGNIINLGQGIPTDIIPILRQHPTLSNIHYTVESGVSGGIPNAVPDFGISSNPESMIRQDDMFTFYNGGGLDITFLGFAEVDSKGNVNVSNFGNRAGECGGFIDISQYTRKLVFCGSFSAKGLSVDKVGNTIKIVEEGSLKKFVKRIKQITFSGQFASQNKQEVLFITERGVFRLINDEIELIEIAPGVNLEEDIIKNMDFIPRISSELKMMDMLS
jgi:propionate CoA-transferase